MNVAPVQTLLLDSAILALWRARCDTLEIARRLNKSEAQIANRLAQLRDGERVQ